MKAIIALGLIGLLSQAYAIEKSQCGPTDERVLSYDPSVGRMLKTTNADAGCTGTLISRTCMVSAGHCKDYANLVEFNTRASILWIIIHPGPENIYFKNDIIDFENSGEGNDWMVFRVRPNRVTGELAGDLQGSYNFSFEMPEVPLDLVITGYGRSEERKANFAQQVGYGELRTAEGTILGHNIDTEAGNSGAAIVERISNTLIGVHTHGGCGISSSEGSRTNKGTMLATRKKFQEAIENCLKMERDEL